MAGTQYWGTGYPEATQATSFTTAVGAIASAVGTQIRKVRIIVTSSAYVSIGTTSASSSDFYIAANVPEYFTIRPNTKVSAISSVTATTGFLFVTAVS